MWKWRCDLCGIGGERRPQDPDPFDAHDATLRHRLTLRLPAFLRMWLLQKHRAEEKRNAA